MNGASYTLVSELAAIPTASRCCAAGSNVQVEGLPDADLNSAEHSVGQTAWRVFCSVRGVPHGLRTSEGLAQSAGQHG